jgi:flavin reductase (DIM6/NTAB) family NADH-FMN oxidoreductase RutF
MTSPHVASEEFISAMRQFPAAVNLVTTGTGEDRAGFTASAVMSLTAEPPQIGVAVNRNASAFPQFKANRAFCVNTLAAHHSELARRFAGVIKGNERFLTGSWGELSTGSPALADAKINLDCIVDREVELSSHVLFIATVQTVRTRSDLKPLLFVEGDWASLLPGFDAGQRDFMTAVEKSIEAIDIAATSSSDPLERLDRFVRNFTQVYIDQQTVTRDYLTAEIYVSPETQDNLNAAKQLFHRKLVDLLDEGRRTGNFDLEDSRVTALAISGLVGWLHRWFRPQGRLTPDEVARLLSDLVRRMVEPRPSSLNEAAMTRKVAGRT